jgi:hypothetical protein
LLHVFKTPTCFSSLLAWPAWLRIAVLLPLLALLWLAVGWATMEVVPL